MIKPSGYFHVSSGKRNVLLALLFCLCFIISRSQDIQLFTEDFESGGASFSLNNGGPGSNSGSNQWIVNNQYSGAPTYPNTTTQDNTTSGTIGFAPTSNYLHIHNSASGITNANYDPANASDQFAYMNFGLCTYGLTDVHISFFYLCEGSAGAYGTVWYSLDGGPWIQTGQPQYVNTTSWTYQDLSEPSFANVGNLRFGFRFQNDTGAPPNTMSFGVDDINIVATYSVADPVEIAVISVAPNPVCEGAFVTIEYELSDTLCDGTYQIELSNASGNFPSPFNTWVSSINYPNTTGSFTVQLPSNASAGDCYTFRINRTSPAPEITGFASACFEIIECPNVITTMQPVVTLDPFPVCVGSAIDIPFFSTGIFENNNVYACQLSEPDGTFATNPPTVGSFANSATYDPMLGSLPGSVSGTVPETEPGCNYFLRVISTNPDAIGSTWGPFCIQQCDIMTNDMQDLNFCVTDCAVDPDGENELIDIDVNTYDNAATYLPGNVFTTQLLSSQTFGQIGNNGILGQVAATGSTELNVHVPCLDSLGIYGLPVGMNYMRIVASNSSVPTNSLGSLIRVTIGAYSNIPQVITSYEYPSGIPKDVFCVGETAMLLFQPFNPAANSTYEWSCNQINGGDPFVSPSGANSNSLFVTLGAPGILTFSIQETNYGCASPWTPEMEITVLGDPNINISGPASICQGDTVSYQVPFIPNTYYNWDTSAPDNAIAYQDTANNVMSIALTETGLYTFSLGVLNACGSDDDTHNVTVVAPPEANAGPDEDICINDEIDLSISSIANTDYLWSDGAAELGTSNVLTVSPEITTEYYVTVTSNLGCESKDTVSVNVLYPEPPTLYFDSICPGGNNRIRLEADQSGTYNWSTGDNTSFTMVSDTGQYYLTVDIPGQLCPHFAEYNVSGLIPDPPIFLLDSVCPNGNFSIQLSADSTGNYIWSTGSMNRFISVGDTGTYTVYIFITDNPCPRTLQYDVIPDTCIVDTTSFNYEPLFFWVPNGFTPNTDDLNDYFAPVFSDISLVRDYHFVIFNRWGEPVFESTDPNEKWTGEHAKGAYYVQDGVYNWLLEFRNVYEVDRHGTRGHVVIMR
jgi:hypothetical protein